MSPEREERIAAFISGFPREVRDLLRAVPEQGGFLGQDQAQEAARRLGWSLERLMAGLLDLARIYASVPVSGFRVGAVAWAGPGPGSRGGLFLGANHEFSAQPLNQSIHAEQAAVVNAWQAGAGELKALAVTDAPCGHCRQFLYEFGAKAKEIRLILPGQNPDSYDRVRLGRLLPRAFGPLDLGREGGPEGGGSGEKELTLKEASSEPLVLEALAAARRSHAPYSGNLSGCALLLDSGRVVCGSCFESAAFNPTLSPLQSAVARLSMIRHGQGTCIKKAVLVELPTAISQREAFAGLLKTWAPGAEMEYHEADL